MSKKIVGSRLRTIGLLGHAPAEGDYRKIWRI